MKKYIFVTKKWKISTQEEVRAYRDSYLYFFHQMDTDEIIETEYLVTDKMYVPDMEESW